MKIDPPEMKSWLRPWFWAYNFHSEGEILSFRQYFFTIPRWTEEGFGKHFE